MFYVMFKAPDGNKITTSFESLEDAEGWKTYYLERGYSGARILVDIETADANLEAAAAAPRRLTIRGKAGYGNWSADGEREEGATAAALR